MSFLSFYFPDITYYNISQLFVILNGKGGILVQSINRTWRSQKTGTPSSLPPSGLPPAQPPPFPWHQRPAVLAATEGASFHLHGFQPFSPNEAQRTQITLSLSADQHFLPHCITLVNKQACFYCVSFLNTPPGYLPSTYHPIFLLPFLSKSSNLLLTFHSLFTHIL